jgi:hypothetical protein
MATAGFVFWCSFRFSFQHLDILVTVSLLMRASSTTAGFLPEDYLAVVAFTCLKGAFTLNREWSHLFVTVTLHSACLSPSQKEMETERDNSITSIYTQPLECYSGYHKVKPPRTISTLRDLRYVPDTGFSASIEELLITWNFIT